MTSAIFETNHSLQLATRSPRIFSPWGEGFSAHHVHAGHDFSEHFFLHENAPYLTLVLAYRLAADDVGKRPLSRLDR